MIVRTFFTVSLIVYLAAVALYILYAIFRKERIGKAATWILAIGLLCQTIALVLRTLEAKHAPFVTTYERLIFCSWLIALICLLLQLRFRIRALGALVTPLTVLAIAIASFSKDARPLIPVLQIHLMEFHIAAACIGYACFAVSFAVGIAYLIKREDGPMTLLPKGKLDMIGRRSIGVGFPFWTLSIISGAIWANVAWGRYWTLYSKETLSLITWFIYGIYLLLRVIARWDGKFSAIIFVVGFAAALFTSPIVLPE